MQTKHLPPYIGLEDRVILFDGVCKLCNAWARFIIKYDKRKLFKLCSVQSAEGKAILQHFNYPSDFYKTMLYVRGDRCYQQSDAFFHVIKELGYPWKIACIFWLLPKPVRNWLYDRIALNRYRMFGKYDYCMLPSPDHASRFLDSQ